MKSPRGRFKWVVCGGFCCKDAFFSRELRLQPGPRGARSSRLRCAPLATGGRRSTREAPGMREREWKRRITERGGPKATFPSGTAALSDS